MPPRLSIIPAAAVFDLDLSPLDLRVLAVIGTHTNRQGWAMLKAKTIGNRLGGVHERTVRKSVKVLAAAGYVEVKRRRTYSEFKVDLNFEGPEVPKEADQDRAGEPGLDRASGPGHERASGPGPYITTSSKRLKGNEENSQSAGPPDDKLFGDSFDEFWRDYPHPKNRGSKPETRALWWKLSKGDRDAALASLPVWRAFYAQSHNAWQSPPMASTFISGRRWTTPPDMSAPAKTERPEWDRTDEVTTAMQDLNFDDEEGDNHGDEIRS